MLTPKAPQLDANPEQVGKLQREDASLEFMFKKAESVEAVEDDKCYVFCGTGRITVLESAFKVV